MLDFKELKQGKDLELLVREILLIKGFRVHWSGKGVDGGKDLICFEERSSEFISDKKIWLIQCKHNAHSENSVGIKDLDDIVDSCNQHGAKGYLLVCSTYPSSAVINRLEGITNNAANNIDATYWDSTKIEQILLTPALWKIAQMFFPKSSKNSSLQVYATENPNQWIVNLRGYHFHLSNRVGSKSNYHFESINKRINDIEKIKLPKGHFIRIRAVHFDDKHADYMWYIDYMFPFDQTPRMSAAQIAYTLGDGEILGYGQYYTFDVACRPYFEFSDHYDKDHYDYYEPYLNNFRTGFKRNFLHDKQVEVVDWNEASEDQSATPNSHFDNLLNKLKSIDFIKVLNAINCNIEHLDKFVRIRNWQELVKESRIVLDHFFSARFLLDIGNNEQEFLTLISFIPQQDESFFRLTKVYVYTPSNIKTGSDFHDDKQSLFELSIKVDLEVCCTKELVRQTINEYFKTCIEAIDEYTAQKNNNA
jgi:hypothetical protein